ncbi:glucose-6-phosphate 1-dehydrogenase [Luteimonas sp. J16]|jgi:glucose-6-phosphate 1-dehydrogenase|uniref:glucose-6-phosphate dehydrogenase n=1 Tax=unclassified Luteimonas TaxID=2629088 RepID=UPI00047ACC67|nr:MULTISPECIES: glucose-6-phosphate dehydrogenase [unclassified Luteimonas]TWG92730.1 glucose-6-phosphate 1-dehydrogenase [Luteimonas sp. J16]
MHDSILLFGATGDLAQRYLFPSLLHLLRDRLLPENFRVVAIGRTQYDDEGFRAWLRERIDEGDGYSGALDDLLARIHYHPLNLGDIDAVAATLSRYADRPAVSYLSTPPNLFAPACRGLKAAGLLEPPSRLVLEKPIGHDLASAREINATLKEALDESRIFRIDHYLGKAPVQNLLALRFGNTLLEAVWDNRCIESVDIVVAETAGVDGREGYYADYGALRDMVQNHMLQLLALIAMEPPAALDADSVRDEKRKVLRALRPMTAADAANDSIRGRYGAGVVEGQAVKGFTADSAVETFVGLRAWIDNWRWAGVPFRLATGKRLPSRTTEVLVNFKPVTHWVFDRPNARGATPNRLRMRLQPEETIELCLMGSLAAPEWGATELMPMSLDMAMLPPKRRIAYERLMIDALKGDQTLFVRDDEVEAAWRWIDSISAAWQQAGTPVLEYPAGSWGPTGAAAFLPRTVGAPSGRRG